jgi:hypothetical protein
VYHPKTETSVNPQLHLVVHVVTRVNRMLEVNFGGLMFMVVSAAAAVQ